MRSVESNASYASHSKSTHKKPGTAPIHFFDAWVSSTGELRSRNGILPAPQVSAWLSLKEGYEIRKDNGHVVRESDIILRLVGCDFWGHPFALGCGSATFEMIRKAFDLHETSEQAMTDNNGAFGRYLTRDQRTDDIDGLALVFKVANFVSIGYDALSLKYDFKTKTTRAYVHGLIEDEMTALIDYLSAHQDVHLFQQPFLIPSQMYRHYRAKTEKHRNTLDDVLYQTEFHIGYAIPGLVTKRPDRFFREVKPLAKKITFEEITRRLHACSTALGAISHTGSIGKELGLFLQKTSHEVDEHMAHIHKPGGARYAESLVQNIEYTTNLFTSLVSQNNILKQRVQNHINLTFSLIAQDENRVTRSIARENALIAVATKRDSTAMKTIALLTIVFLPPTFVATFFSMTMFDWTPKEQNSKIVSKYLWVYWAAALPLTIVVLLSWRVWMRREDQKYQDDLNTARKDNPDGSTDGLQFEAYEITSTAKMREGFSGFE